MLLTVVAVALVAFIVITAFVFVSTVERVVQTEAWCPWYVWCIAFVWFVVGIFADVAFNVIWGTVIFREIPHELLFTARVKRHVKGDGWRGKKARQWADFLNAVDSGHVRLL